ncbi:putative fimbrial protein [Candidatus Burkholderia verschuerenii]|uniref:Putative fimbrial protein n=1 Tax=Candidatus Burkholderia verschuerenii TaxID=242163 RepID=A0A0L0MCW9_9BURK|nr:fimbrial protein [Candidatus Burkholderia verschuerenii]KND60095.1 putative fimbrial protein [Candidatus Burkholderia verschuerenii]
MRALKRAGFAALISLASMTANATMPFDGTIHFTGKALGSTCVVEGGESYVTLPTFSINTMTAGSTAGDTPFTVAVRNCAQTNTKVSVYWNSTDTITENGRLKNNGTATGLELQLLNADGSVIDMSQGEGAQNSKGGTFVDGSASLPYVVRYYFATDRPSQGSIESYVTYSVVYN